MAKAKKGILSVAQVEHEVEMIKGEIVEASAELAIHKKNFAMVKSFIAKIHKLPEFKFLLKADRKIQGITFDFQDFMFELMELDGQARHNIKDAESDLLDWKFELEQTSDRLKEAKDFEAREKKADSKVTGKKKVGKFSVGRGRAYKRRGK